MMTSKESKRRRRMIRFLWILGVTIVLLCLNRNWIARNTIERAGSIVLGAKVTVGKVDLGVSRITIRNIDVDEPDSPETSQLFLEYIAVKPRILSGMRDGVWLEQVVVRKPTLQVRFDWDGKLISTFPTFDSKSDKESRTIPLKALFIRDAKLIVHQVGKQPFIVAVDGVDATFADEIQCEALLSSFLGGSVKLKSKLNANTLAGSTQIVVDNLRLDTEQLCQKALIPISIGNDRITGSGFLRATIQHPRNDLDLRHHSFELLAQLESFRGEKVGDLCSQLDLSIRNRDGHLHFTAKGNPLDGFVNAEITSDLNASPVIVKTAANVRHVQLESFATLFDLGLSIRALGNLDATAAIQFASDWKTMSFSGKVIPRVSGISIDSLPLKDFSAEVVTTGAYKSSDASPLSGTLSGSFGWGGISVPQLVELADLKNSDGQSFANSTGRVTAQGSFRIPLDNLDKPKSYLAKATLSARNLACRDMVLEDTDVHLTLEKNEARVILPETHLFARTSGGRQLEDDSASVSGSIQAQLNSPDNLTARFSAENIGLQMIARLIGMGDSLVLQDGTALTSGTVSTHGSATVAVSQITNRVAWDGEVRLSTRNIAVGGETISDFATFAKLHRGKIEIPETAVSWRNTECRFVAAGSIVDTPEIAGAFSIKPVLLGDVSQLASQFSNARLTLDGKAEIDGKFSVQGSPITFDASGNANLIESSYAGKQIGNAKLGWKANLAGLMIKSSSDNFLGGSYYVGATMRDLDWTKTEVAGEFRDISSTHLLAVAGLTIPSTGVINGGLKIRSIKDWSTIEGGGWLESRGLTVNRIPIELADAKLNMAEGQISLTSRGKVRDGSFDSAAQSGLASLIEFVSNPERRLHEMPVFGEARLTAVPIEQLVSTFGKRELAPLRGSVQGHCVRDASTIENGLLCRLSGSLENVSWNHSRLSDRLVADVSVAPDRVTLQQVRGRFADGAIKGHAEFSLQGRPHGTFRFSANRVSLRRACAPFVDRATTVSGNGNLTVSGRIGQTITGNAVVSGDNANVAGLDVRRVRLPVDWSFSSDSQVARWRCRSGVVEVGGGNVYVSSEGSYSRGIDMATAVRLDRVDTSKLMRAKSFGVGIVTGRATFNAKRATSLRQLTGRFDIDLAQVKPLEVPVLDQLPQMVQLPKLGVGRRDTNGGFLSGRLAQGMVHLDEFSLSQSNIHILTDGTATFDGRLNLNVTASTEDSSPIDDLISLADSPLMIAGAAPVAWLARANEAMKNRVVSVQIAGTAKRPVLRLQTAKQLTQNALKFFIRSSIGSNVPAFVADRSNGTRR